jgi:hypothetical protein
MLQTVVTGVGSTIYVMWCGFEDMSCVLSVVAVVWRAQKAWSAFIGERVREPGLGEVEKTVLGFASGETETVRGLASGETEIVPYRSRPTLA